MFDPQLILGIGSALVGAAVQLSKQSRQDQFELLKMSIASLKASDESADKAEKRGSSWGRRFAMFVVLTVAFGGLFYSAANGIKVSQIIETKPIIDLLGLIKIGGGPRVIEASGFVIPQYVEDSVISIIFFLFGSSAAKR